MLVFQQLLIWISFELLNAAEQKRLSKLLEGTRVEATELLSGFPYYS